MAAKEYFEESTIAAMRRMSQVRFQTKRNLADRIDDLGDREVGIVAVRLIPNRFMSHAMTEEAGAHEWQKHGFYYPIEQPTDESAAASSRDIPLAFRKRAVARIRDDVGKAPERFEGIGFSYHGIGKDTRVRTIELGAIGKAHRLLSYAKSIGEPIVQHVYSNPNKEEVGATILCSVPSRRKGVADYAVKIEGVPYFNGTDKRALAWSMETTLPGHAPMNSLANIQLSKDRPIKASAQEMTAYMAIIEHELGQHNFTPLEMNPYPLFSREQARFALKLANQVLVQDITTKKMRKLYEAEQSWILMQRAISQGHDRTLYWDPARDGMMSSYNLSREALSVAKAWS